MEIDWDNWSPDEVTFEMWCYEYVRLLRQIDPKWGHVKAMELARTEVREYMRGIPPVDCLHDQIDSWTDDGG
jgi:hypothetical protein